MLMVLIYLFNVQINLTIAYSITLTINRHSMTMPKPKASPKPPKLVKKPRKPRTTVVFDQDDAWKNYISKDFFDCLSIIHPILFAAVDTLIAPEFLEQEMSNAMRGKYKVKGKEKKTDKLVKLRLLTGQDYYIYVHLEIQDQLQDDFPERLYIYRSLISLRYMTQNITTIVIFTGKAPSEKHTIFHHECFNSFVLYKFNYFVIAEQIEKELEASDSAFALAVLAAKYTIDTEGDEQRRLEFKKKIFELAEKKQFPFDKLEELLRFVIDYMLLSDEVENEFIATTSSPIFSPQNTDSMVATRGERTLAAIYTTRIYGKTTEALLAEQKAEQKAEKKAEKNAIQEAERQNTINALLTINFSPEKIADVLGYNLKYV
jgi:hypothetical protein